jgi:HSP20 family protein
MSIIKYNAGFSPVFRNIDRDELLTPFDKFVDEFFAATAPQFSQDFGNDFFTAGSYPKVDIVDYSDKITIEAEIPGLSKEDVSVDVQENVLTISGGKVKKINDKSEDGKYVRRELKKSSFKRSFTLGQNLDKEGVNAKFENGILNVSITKIKPSIPEKKTVKIQ